jgi:excisionase family DNA binding protein
MKKCQPDLSVPASNNKPPLVRRSTSPAAEASPTGTDQGQWLLTINAAADLLSVHRSTLIRAWKSGELPIVRIGRRMLIRVSHLERFIRTREQGGSSDHRLPTSTIAHRARISEPKPPESADTAGSTRSSDGIKAAARARSILERHASTSQN